MNAATLLTLQIVANDANQPRIDDLDEAHIEQLALIPDQWPPLIVVEIGGEHILVDGFHRLQAAKQLGLQAVPVSIVDVPTDGDLIALAFQLNSKHGRPLSLADRKQHAGHQLRANPSQSDREISRKTGIAAGTVAVIRKALEDGAQIEQAPERVGADGRSYSTQPARQLGELPEANLGEWVGDGLKDLFSSKERRNMRANVRYLQRVSVALMDQYELPGWTCAEDAAAACVAAIGEDAANELGEQLMTLLQDLSAVVILISPGA